MVNSKTSVTIYHKRSCIIIRFVFLCAAMLACICFSQEAMVRPTCPHTLKDIHGIASSSPAAPALQAWNRTWGGTNIDEGNGVAVDKNGNIYIVGDTSSFGVGYGNAFLAKYAMNGTQLWNQTWGGTDDDEGNGVAVDGSGNVFIAGATSSFASGQGNYAAFLAKYSTTGTQLWNKTWGGTGDDEGHGVAVDGSGNAYLVGFTSTGGAGGYDAFIAKYSSSGSFQWSKTWGGTGDNEGYGAAVDGSGNIYLAGFTNSTGAGGYDAFLAKYSSSDTLQWSKTWGGKGDDEGYGVAIDGSNNAYLIGFTNSFGAGNYDAFLAKYAGNGTQLWNSTWGGKGDDEGYGVAIDGSNNAYLAGYTNSFGAGGYDAFLAKFAGNGTQQWNRTWGGTKDDFGYGVAVTSNGTTYLTGDTLSFGAGNFDAFLAKYVPAFYPNAPYLNPIIPNPSTNGTISLSWNASTGVVFYKLYRYTRWITTLNGSLTTVGTSASTIGKDTGLINGTYYYIVTAVNASGESAISNCQGVTVTIHEPCPPVLNAPAPNPSTNGTLFLSWTASSGATSYNLYRYTRWITAVNESVTLVGSFNSTSGKDTRLVSGTYYYVVTAINASGESGISNCASGVIAISPLQTPPSSYPYTLMIIIISCAAIGVVALVGVILYQKRRAIAAKSINGEYNSVNNQDTVQTEAPKEIAKDEKITKAVETTEDDETTTINAKDKEVG